MAILVFALGAGISLYEGVLHIIKPEPITNPMVNYVVLTLSLIFEGGAWYMAFREFSAGKGQVVVSAGGLNGEKIRRSLWSSLKTGSGAGVSGGLYWHLAGTGHRYCLF